MSASATQGGHENEIDDVCSPRKTHLINGVELIVVQDHCWDVEMEPFMLAAAAQ